MRKAKFAEKPGEPPAPSKSRSANPSARRRFAPQPTSQLENHGEGENPGGAILWGAGIQVRAATLCLDHHLVPAGR